jgi:hypothetical protein
MIAREAIAKGTIVRDSSVKKTTVMAMIANGMTTEIDAKITETVVQTATGTVKHHCYRAAHQAPLFYGIQ